MAETLTVQGRLATGAWELVYAGPGPTSERAHEELVAAGLTGRHDLFDLKRWDCGDSDGDYYLPDGRPCP